MRESNHGGRGEGRNRSSQRSGVPQARLNLSHESTASSPIPPATKSVEGRGAVPKGQTRGSQQTSVSSPPPIPAFITVPMTDPTGKAWNYDVYTFPKNWNDIHPATRSVDGKGTVQRGQARGGQQSSVYTSPAASTGADTSFPSVIFPYESTASSPIPPATRSTEGRGTVRRGQARGGQQSADNGMSPADPDGVNAEILSDESRLISPHTQNNTGRGTKKGQATGSEYPKGQEYKLNYQRDGLGQNQLPRGKKDIFSFATQDVAQNDSLPKSSKRYRVKSVRGDVDNAPTFRPLSNGRGKGRAKGDGINVNATSAKTSPKKKTPADLLVGRPKKDILNYISTAGSAVSLLSKPFDLMTAREENTERSVSIPDAGRTVFQTVETGKKLKTVRERAAARKAARSTQPRKISVRTAQRNANAQAVSKSVKKAQTPIVQRAVSAATKAVKADFAAIGSFVTTNLIPILLGGAILALIIIPIFGVTAVATQPMAVFFVRAFEEEDQNPTFQTAIQRLDSSYRNAIYSELLKYDYDHVEVDCDITNSDDAWKTIISAYAVEVCHRDMLAGGMDNDHYDVLSEVFRKFYRVSSSSRTETSTYEEEDTYTEIETRPVQQIVTDELGVTTVIVGEEEYEVEVPYTYTVTSETTVVKLTVRGKTPQQLAALLNFDEDETLAMQELIHESDEMWASLKEVFTDLRLRSSNFLDIGGGMFMDVAQYSTVAETIYRALIGAGYSQEAACGILGNVQQECSMNPNDTTGKYYGICQWGDARLTRLKSYPNYQTAATQTAFLLWELDRYTGWWHTYGADVSYTYNGVRIESLADFKACSNPRAAAAAFLKVFERANEPVGDWRYENRCKYAEEWYVYARSHWDNSGDADSNVSDDRLAEIAKNMASRISAAITKHEPMKNPTLEKIIAEKHTDCNAYVSVYLQEIGALKKGDKIGHRPAGTYGMYGEKLLDTTKVTVHKNVNRKFDELPNEYKRKGCIYIYDSNSGIYMGNGQIYSFSHESASDLHNYQKNRYNFSHDIEVVITIN